MAGYQQQLAAVRPETESQVELLLRESGCLVTLPEVCARLRRVLEDPDHRRPEVCEVIMHDPALTTRLLRIVNSAYFGLRTRVRTVSHALAILGEQDLHNLVLVTSLVQSVDPSRQQGFDLKRFWQTGIYCAVLARELSQSLALEAREEMFIAGLLLNVGKLPLYYHEPALYQEVSRLAASRHCDSSVIERELLGFDHSEVGALLARRWNFSEGLAACIEAHHRPAVEDEMSRAIARLCGALEQADGGQAGKHLKQAGLDSLPAALTARALEDVVAHSRQASLQVYDAFFGQHHGN